MGDAKLDDNGKIRIGIIICAIIAVVMKGPAGVNYYSSLYACIFVEAVFLVLGCVGLGENDIVKIIDKVLQLLLALLVIIFSVIFLFEIIMFALDHGFGGNIWYIIGGIFALIAGCGCASLAATMWK